MTSGVSCVPPLPDSWEAARLAYEQGAHGVAEIARQLGVSHQAVSKRRTAEGWADPPQVAPPTVNGAPAPVQPPSWAERVPVEAAAAGITAAVLRQRLVMELNANPFVDPETGERIYRATNHLMVRALSDSYATFVKVAQLLSGEQTEQVGVVLNPEDRKLRLLEVLARVKERAIETTSTEAPEANGD